MGLGKTVQCISFLSAVFSKTGKQADMYALSGKRALIVVPASLIYQWEEVSSNHWAYVGTISHRCVQEMLRWGYFKIAVLHGKRGDVLTDAKNGVVEVCARCDRARAREV